MADTEPATAVRVAAYLAAAKMTAGHEQEVAPLAPGDPDGCAEFCITLAAAVEAALALTGEWQPTASASYSALEEDRAWIRQECATALRQAITTALLREVPE